MFTSMNFIGCMMFSSFLGITLNGCSLSTTGTDDSGKSITKKYHTTAFNRIENETVADIVFTQGPTSRVEAEGSEFYIACMEVEVKDSTLQIRIPKKDSNRFKNVKVTLSVSSPELCDVQQKGVGEVLLKDNLKAQHLTLNVSGVGDLKAEALDIQTLEATQRGVGDMLLQGKCDHAELDQVGVGSLRAKDLDAKHVIARQKGVGSLSCRASKTIAIHATGVGSVDYYGDAQVTELKKAGLGSVEKRN